MAINSLARLEARLEKCIAALVAEPPGSPGTESAVVAVITAAESLVGAVRFQIFAALGEWDLYRQAVRERLNAATHDPLKGDHAHSVPGEYTEKRTRPEVHEPGSQSVQDDIDRSWNEIAAWGKAYDERFCAGLIERYPIPPGNYIFSGCSVSVEPVRWYAKLPIAPQLFFLVKKCIAICSDRCGAEVIGAEGLRLMDRLISIADNMVDPFWQCRTRLAAAWHPLGRTDRRRWCKAFVAAIENGDRDALMWSSAGWLRQYMSEIRQTIGDNWIIGMLDARLGLATAASFDPPRDWVAQVAAASRQILPTWLGCGMGQHGWAAWDPGSELWREGLCRADEALAGAHAARTLLNAELVRATRLAVESQVPNESARALHRHVLAGDSDSIDDSEGVVRQFVERATSYAPVELTAFAHYALARLLVARAQWMEALQHLERALELWQGVENPPYASIVLALCVCAEAEAQRQVLCGERMVSSAGPTDARDAVTIALKRLGAGHPAHAMAIIASQMFGDAPEDPETLSAAADVLVEFDHPEAAVWSSAASLRALSLRTDTHPEIVDNAIAVVEAVVECLGPRHWAVGRLHLTAAEIAVTMGRSADAGEQLNRARPILSALMPLTGPGCDVYGVGPPLLVVRYWTCAARTAEMVGASNRAAVLGSALRRVRAGLGFPADIVREWSDGP